MSENTLHENKMGTMNIVALLISMALPMMASMMVQALYNIVDSYFIARDSYVGLTAVSLAFPIQSLMIALATGTGVGINALLSMRLGQKDFKAVNETAFNGIFLSICTFFVFMILGFTIPEFFYRKSIPDEQVIAEGVKYTRIILIFSLGLFSGITFERLLQSTGKTLFSMIAQLAGAITNIILDPILIFGLLGLPALGITGAAIATVIGQFVTLIIAIIFNLTINKEIDFSLKDKKISGQTIWGIYKVGIPSILLAAIGSVMTYLFNRILVKVESIAISVFGIYFKLQSFIFMPVFGMNNALVPIIAYNYGARHKKRITGTIKLGLGIAVGIMLIGTALFELIPGPLIHMFDQENIMALIGIPALRIIGIHFVMAAFSIIFMSVFQALGKGIYSMIISFVRQLVILLPAAKLLSLTGNVNNIWWSFPIAEVVGVSIAIIFMVISYRKEIAPLTEAVNS